MRINEMYQMKVLEFLKSDKTSFGFVIGVIAPFLGFYIYYQLEFADHVSLRAFIKFISSPGLLSKVISLSVLINLPLFFFFIMKKRDLSARGVLTATFIFAAIIAYLKFGA